MTRVRESTTNPKEMKWALEARLRDLFAKEIEVQQDRAPDLSFILVTARIETLQRRRARIAITESVSEVLVLGSLAALLAVCWEEVSLALQSALPLAGFGVPSITVLGAGAALLAAVVTWSVGLARAS